MFKKILVALDGSTCSSNALPSAIAIARKFEGEIFVLHVSEHDRGRASGYDLESPAEATSLVAGAVADAQRAGVKASGDVVDAAAQHAARVIVETAAAQGSDLIVMGSRGLSDVQGLLLGSVTHRVIQSGPVPVLVTRAAIKEKVVAPEPVRAIAY